MSDLPSRNLSIVFSVCLGASACDGVREMRQDAGPVADGAGRDAPCPGVAALAPLARPPHFAVVLTDYASTAIAMLDADGELLDERWVDSGTTHPGLVATLSGDVAMPTRQAGDGTLTLLDRYRTDVITRFCVADGTLVGQVRTHGPAATTSFSSNPQDVLFVGPHEAWVTRYETALDPAAPEVDRGSDLLGIDPTAMTRRDVRIDLSSFAGASFVPDAMKSVLARPSRIVGAGDFAAVGLDRIGAGFDAAGEGMLGVVELSTGDVTALSLPGMASCGHVVPVPGTSDRVLVTCAGFPITDAVARRATSGLVLVEIPADGEAQIAASFRPADTSLATAISLGGTRALGVAIGDLATGEPDRLVRVDLASGETADVLASTGAYELGTSAFDEATGLVLVPDASAGIRILALGSDGSLDPRETLPIGLALGLPPRHVGVIE